jgi:hypothetical protein
MSTFSASKINAEAIQGYLENHYSAFGAPNLFTNTPMMEFLLSPINTNNLLKQTVAPGRGKKRTATTLYTPRVAESEIETNITRDCSSTNEAGHLDQQCEIDLSVGVKHDEHFDFADLASIDEDNGAYMGRRLAAMLDGMRRKQETQIVASVAAAPGAFSSKDTASMITADVKTVRTIKSGTTEDLSMQASEEIWFTKEQIGWPNVYTFGSNAITKYARALGDACCVDAGVDLREYNGNNGWVHFNTYRVPDALSGTEGFLALVPGAAHLIYMNLYEGPNQFVDNTKVRGVLVDPITGYPYDYAFDVGCDDVTIQLSTPFTVCTAPDGYFGFGDPHVGVNGIFEYAVDNS